MFRKILVTGLAFVVMASTFNANVYAQENVETESVLIERDEANVWDGTSTEMPKKTIVVDGKYYYQISNAAQLAYIAQNNSDWCDNNYILTSDIVLNEEVEYYCDLHGAMRVSNESRLNVWTPIAQMNGVFDGAGYTISGVYVPNGTGFFGATNEVKNLTITESFVKGGSAAGIAASTNRMDNCKFSGCVYATDISNCNAAGVVSYAAGDVTNCVAEGVVLGEGEVAAGIVANGTSECTVKNCTNYSDVTAYKYAAGIMAKGHYFVDCTNEGNIEADESYAGGIAVTNYNDLTGCTNNGNVNAFEFAGGICAEAKGKVSKCVNNEKSRVSADINAGGIVGTVSALITDCVNYASVGSQNNAGGIAGIVDYNYPGTIRNCINYGETDAYGCYSGGILGYAEVGSANESTVIDNCYNFADMQGKYMGGIAGYVKNYNINQCYNAGKITGYKEVGGIAGFSSHVSGTSTVSGCYYLDNNSSYSAFGNVADDVIGVAEAKPVGFFPALVDSNADPSYAYLGGADLLFFVNRMYEVALNRESEPAGRLNWFVALKNGTLDGAAIAGQFVLGDEFKLRGLSDSEYIDVLYSTIFDRAADLTGKNHWLNMMASGYSREYVLAQLVNLDEFTLLCDRYGISRGVMLDNGVAVNPGIPQFVSRLYNQVLGRTPESAGLNSNVMALVVKAETAESVAKNFFGSEEYALKNTDNATYVKDLYAVFMGREADEEGLNFWVSCITDQGASRDWVLSEFAKSEEFKIIAASYGL